MLEFIKKFAVDLGGFIKGKLDHSHIDGVYRSKVGEPIVYDIDILAEKYIANYFDRHRPPFKVISEDSREYDIVKNPEYVVIIDPLDGSSNATMGVPIYNISVAVCALDIMTSFSFDKVLMGAIYSPNTKNLYYAKKGEGAFRNGSGINSPISNTLESWYVGAIFKLPSKHDLKFLSNFKSFRCFGCATEHICALIRGDNQAYFAFDNKLRVYDIAAAGIILKEAGGDIMTLHGNEIQVGINDKLNFLACADKKDISSVIKLLK